MRKYHILETEHVGNLNFGPVFRALYTSKGTLNWGIVLLKHIYYAVGDLSCMLNNSGSPIQASHLTFFFSVGDHSWSS